MNLATYTYPLSITPSLNKPPSHPSFLHPVTLPLIINHPLTYHPITLLTPLSPSRTPLLLLPALLAVRAAQRFSLGSPTFARRASPSRIEAMNRRSPVDYYREGERDGGGGQGGGGQGGGQGGRDEEYLPNGYTNTMNPNGTVNGSESYQSMRSPSPTLPFSPSTEGGGGSSGDRRSVTFRDAGGGPGGGGGATPTPFSPFSPYTPRGYAEEGDVVNQPPPPPPPTSLPSPETTELTVPLPLRPPVPPPPSPYIPPSSPPPPPLLSSPSHNGDTPSGGGVFFGGGNKDKDNTVPVKAATTTTTTPMAMEETAMSPPSGRPLSRPQSNPPSAQGPGLGPTKVQGKGQGGSPTLLGEARPQRHSYKVSKSNPSPSTTTATTTTTPTATTTNNNKTPTPTTTATATMAFAPPSVTLPSSQDTLPKGGSHPPVGVNEGVDEGVGGASKTVSLERLGGKGASPPRHPWPIAPLGTWM